MIDRTGAETGCKSPGGKEGGGGSLQSSKWLESLQSSLGPGDDDTSSTHTHTESSESLQ